MEEHETVGEAAGIQVTEQPVLSASIFKAYDIRGIVGQTLTEEVVYAIGRAIGSEARDRGLPAVVVARDGRLSGPAFLAALSDGICATGTDVIDIGLAPTPLLYYATHALKTGSGVMVTGNSYGLQALRVLDVPRLRTVAVE